MSIESPTVQQVDDVVEAFVRRQDEFDLFRKQVEWFFLTSRHFHTGKIPLVHSVKSRLKSIDHLRDKVNRKWSDGPITNENLFERITDFAGVRVLHLHSKQIAEIHARICEHVKEGHWQFVETPVAYSWDPEATDFFSSLGMETKTRDTYYTSVHYLVRPQASVPLTCEIQVRTLFEEIWGEIDHAMNYPVPTNVLACREQLRVLAKLASTGTRLADSIFASLQAS